MREILRKLDYWLSTCVLSLVCVFKGHVESEIKQASKSDSEFVGYWMCKRCDRQVWLEGEHGRFKGVRFLNEPPDQTG